MAAKLPLTAYAIAAEPGLRDPDTVSKLLAAAQDVAAQSSVGNCRGDGLHGAAMARGLDALRTLYAPIAHVIPALAADLRALFPA